MKPLFLQIHDQDPQPRLIKQVVEAVRKGAVLILPTDSGYAIACGLGEKQALDRIRDIRKLDDKHNFTLLCRDLSEIGTYAKMDNSNYRLLKQHTPGGFTFVLKATSEVPKRLMHPKRKTIGLRVPDNTIAMALLEELGAPLMSVSLILPGDDSPLVDPYEIRDLLSHQVDVIIDGGFCGFQATSVIALFDEQPEILREGLGDISAFK